MTYDEQRRTGERLLSAVFHGALDAMLLADDQGRYVEANPAACELFGLPRDSLLGRQVSEFCVPDYQVDTAWSTFQQDGRMRGRFVLRRLDGEVRQLDFSAVTNILPGLHLSILRDVTEHQRAAEELTAQLRASELRYRRIVESTSEGVWVTDAENRTTFVNGRMADMLGYSRDEMLGHSPGTLATGSSARDAGDHLFTEGADNREHQLRRRDGHPLWVCATTNTLVDEQGNYEGSISLVTDMSERRKAAAALEHTEAQLRQAQKMEAVGCLAGGLAHDFNNLLSVILSYTSMVIAGLPATDATRRDLEEVFAAGTRAADLTRQLLAFSRQQVLQPRVFDLNKVVLGVERMLARLLGEDITLTVTTSPELGNVHADPGQIEQVLVNLVVNARDAMPGGGTITLETSNIKLHDVASAARHGVTPGDYVMVTVSDTGSGMEPAVRERVFDPFFTTKEQGKGTGLGLSMAYGIVQQSNGHISVESKAGAGSSFTIYLPRTGRALEAAPPAPPPTTRLQGDETVLLVEDEKPVRVLLCSILRKCGYNVLEAQNAGEAFLIGESHTGVIHLLLTDVVMPHISGIELAERLTTSRPEMMVLYMSGYAEDTISDHGVLDVDVAFLQKPITPDMLVHKVREVLTGAEKASLWSATR